MQDPRISQPSQPGTQLREEGTPDTLPDQPYTLPDPPSPTRSPSNPSLTTNSATPAGANARPQQGVPGPNSGPSGAPPLALPPRPTSLAETNLDPTLLEELALRVVASLGTCTAGDLAERLRLPLSGVVEHLIGSLRQQNLLEPISGGSALMGIAGIRLRATERGILHAHRSGEYSSRYVGPAPVPLATYDYALRQGLAGRTAITRDLIWRRLAHLVLPDETVDRIGAGIQSGLPIFLFGHAGNGKTAIAAAVARALAGGVLVPFAVEVDGQIVRVFDPNVHHILTSERIPNVRFDERWALCQTPFVHVGGELRLEHLDLVWNERQRFYDAPIQMKAGGGVLLIDDFGRQQFRPELLLSRWIVPLETGIDYLSLITGRQVPLPFTPLLVFATNLELQELTDEAFLRRLPCKVVISDPTPEEFREICRRACAELGIEFTEPGFTHLLEQHYMHTGRELRSSHPRDLLRLVTSAAHYFGLTPQLTADLVDAAATLYFLEPATS